MGAVGLMSVCDVMCLIRSNTSYHQGGRPAADSAVGERRPLLLL